MENSIGGNNEYIPKTYVEKQEYFSASQKEFLENQVSEMKEDALQEDDYTKVYSEDFIQKSKDKVTERENDYKLTNQAEGLQGQLDENRTVSKEYLKVSEYLEALFYKKLGGKNGWIPNAIVWKTSKYDDYVNGIDFVVETDDKEFTLATDVTFSHAKGLIHKLEHTKKFIKGGNLPTLTFYERNEETVGKPIPHVTIAVEHEKVIKALKLWTDGQGDMLENHPLKAKTMLELEAQLESFATYAKAIDRRTIASAYNDMLSKIQLLIVGHEDVIKKYQKQIDDDEAYKTIIKFCEDLKKEAEQLEKIKREGNN